MNEKKTQKTEKEFKKKKPYTFRNNVLNKFETQNIIKESLKFIAESISSSIGPYGSNTLIQSLQGSHSVTKDGYTILKNLVILDVPNRTILDLVRRISKSLVSEVGDGSSSVIVIAQKLYSELINFKKENNLTDYEVNFLLTEIKGYLLSELDNIGKQNKITSVEEIRNIATISSNNNKEMGDFVTQIFSNLENDLVFHIENSNNEEFSFERINGYEHERGYISPRMASDFPNGMIEYDNPLVFMSNGTIDRNDCNYLLPLMQALIFAKMQEQQIPPPLILIGKNYDLFVKELLEANKAKFGGAFTIVAIDIATGTSNALEQFNDLAIFLGADPVDKLANEQVGSSYNVNRLGKCKKIIITDSKTKFVEGNTNIELAKSRVAELKEVLKSYEREDSPFDRSKEEYFLKKRIASLSQKMIKVLVGGITELEKTSNKFLVEDAILACKSALDSGYTIGGNLTVPFILDDYIKKNELSEDSNLYKIAIVIKKSFLYAYWKILLNYYGIARKDEINSIIETCMEKRSIFNLLTKEFETSELKSVVNPINTEKEILTSCFSIIGLLANTNQFINLAI
jgi:chaperonin GroEL